MQLARFKAFAEELASDEHLAAYVDAHQLFRYHEDHWYDQRDSDVTDLDLVRNLSRTRRNQTCWRAVHSCTTYFPLSAFAAVLAATFPSPARKPTHDRVNRLLQAAIDRSSNHFDATHDALTGLRNRQSFERVLEERIQSAVRSNDSDTDEAASIASARLTITSFALDIDRFKQVNDTHGHLYGDIVLRCFAARLQNRLDGFQRDNPKIENVDSARPSGEEFCVLFTGVLSADETKHYAEELRDCIASQPLPSEHEWGSLTLEDRHNIENLPPASNRRITVSVGIASALNVESDSTREIADGIRLQADKALYCAKAGGRNTYRHFDDILARYGRVLEHHSDTDVVTIDIGAQVGVSRGQEFLVYHPDFSGNRPFTYDDGRTIRSLGTYPRVSCGRIVVFDVQDDISFCNIAEREGSQAFKTGSFLEAVPLGSIGHLLAPGPLVTASPAGGLATLSDLESRIRACAERGDTPSALVILLCNDKRVYSERGSAFINETLAHLYEILRDQFGPVTSIAQARDPGFELALDVSRPGDLGERGERVLRKIADILSGLAHFSAGMFDHESVSYDADGDRSHLDPGSALQYARFAAIVARSENGTLERFTPAVAQRVILLSEEQRRYHEALKDYVALRALGVENSNLENQAALCAFRINDHPTMLEASERAVALHSDDQRLRANRAVFLYVAGRAREAHQVFQEMGPKAAGELSRVYCYYAAMCEFAVYKEEPDAVDVQQLLQTLRETKQACAQILKGSSLSKIDAAIMEIQAQTADVVG